MLPSSFSGVSSTTPGPIDIVCPNRGTNQPHAFSRRAKTAGRSFILHQTLQLLKNCQDSQTQIILFPFLPPSFSLSKKKTFASRATCLAHLAIACQDPAVWARRAKTKVSMDKSKAAASIHSPQILMLSSLGICLSLFIRSLLAF